MEYLQVGLIFIAVVLLIEGLYLMIRIWRNPERRRIREQLRQLSGEPYGRQEISIVRRRIMSDIPWFNRILLNIRLPLIYQLEKMAVQANLKYPLGVYLLSAVLLFVVGYMAAYVLSASIWVSLAAAVLAGVSPLFYIRKKKQIRIRQFEDQLPEALDMLARSMKAGHAFTGGLQMVSQEFGDPAGAEFRKTLEEINFGVAYEDALKNMIMRVDSEDLKLFAISVIIQRETGGNLAEILENIARLMRGRVVLKGQINTLSAEARLSGVVLTVLPFLMGFALFFLNREYVSLLAEDPMGHVMLLFAGIMMVVGIYVMRRMAQFKV